MDPFTFGIVATGAFGGALYVVSLLEQAGFKINQTAISIVLETTKYGAILWLMKAMTVLL